MEMVYQKSFSEVLYLINMMSDTIREKIPASFIEFMKNNCDTSFTIGDISLEKPETLLQESKVVLSLIYRSYLIDDNEIIKDNKEDINENSQKIKNDKEEIKENTQKINNNNEEITENSETIKNDNEEIEDNCEKINNNTGNIKDSTKNIQYDNEKTKNNSSNIKDKDTIKFKDIQKCNNNKVEKCTTSDNTNKIIKEQRKEENTIKKTPKKSSQEWSLVPKDKAMTIYNNSNSIFSRILNFFKRILGGNKNG